MLESQRLGRTYKIHEVRPVYSQDATEADGEKRDTNQCILCHTRLTHFIDSTPIRRRNGKLSAFDFQPTYRGN